MAKHVVNKQDSFFQMVYEVVRLIPRGRVTSYGEKPPVPAQRVVNRNGLLTGKHHFGSPDLMRQLLENEGVRVDNDQIADFKKHFWDPSEEL